MIDKRRIIKKSIYSSMQQKNLKNIILRELILNYGYFDKVKIAERIAEDMVEIFERYAKGKEEVGLYEVLWAGIDRYATPQYGKSMKETKLKSVILKLWKEDEIKKLSEGESFKKINYERVIRLTKESAREESLLNPTDLSLLTGIEVTKVREIIREHEKKHKEVVPTRSRIHDMGPHQTHKKIIIKLHIKGMSTSEIAKMTEHNPENVDRYISSYKRVKELYKTGMNITKISFITGVSQRLVEEYIDILKSLE